MADSVTNSMNMSLSKLQETVKDRETWRAAVHGVTKSWTRPESPLPAPALLLPDHFSWLPSMASLLCSVLSSPLLKHVSLILPSAPGSEVPGLVLLQTTNSFL